MPVDDWFYGWYLGHTARHPRHDWPDLDTDKGAVFYAGLRDLLVKKGVHDLDVATEASELMLDNPPKYLDQHGPALHAAAVQIFKARAADAAGNPIDDRESAAIASKACRYCDGIGLAVVWASKPDPEKKIGETASAYCICALGRWAEANHREKSPDVRKRIPDLRDVLNGRSFWRLNPPGMAAAEPSRVAVGVAPQPDRDAVEASMDCPECEGTGWAKRRALWHSMDRPYLIILTCRCPLGAWRSAHDEQGMYDSLQANPRVWDGTLSHPTWTRRAIDSPCITAEGTDGEWRYLHPSEPAPPVGDLHDMARRTAGDMARTPRPEWMGKVDPAVPIPPKPAAPEPEPGPTRSDVPAEVTP